MPQYRISASFTLDADDRNQALSMVAACVEYWDDDNGINHITGVGGAEGSVTIRKAEGRE